jgi:DNA-binding MurR/RpiR family transcriptional regulator
MPRHHGDRTVRQTKAHAQLPRDFDGLRSLILERRKTLPKRIAQIAQYSLDNPDDIAFGTAASIAESAGVQPSTLIRFAHQLGFDGFTSLQSVFRERLRERNSSYDERLSALHAGTDKGHGHRAIFEGFVTASSASLAKILHSVDEKTIDQAVAVLAKAETIFIVARRRSYPVASYVAYALGKLGIRYQLVESAAGLSPEILSLASVRDAAFAVSFSPYAPASIEEVRQLSEQGVPVVAITDSAFSPLAQFAKVWFEVAEADFTGFRSLAATMALSIALAVGVGEKRRARSKKGNGRGG